MLREGRVPRTCFGAIWCQREIFRTRVSKPQVDFGGSRGEGPRPQRKVSLVAPAPLGSCSLALSSEMNDLNPLKKIEAVGVLTHTHEITSLDTHFYTKLLSSLPHDCVVKTSSFLALMHTGQSNPTSLSKPKLLCCQLERRSTLSFQIVVPRFATQSTFVSQIRWTGTLAFPFTLQLQQLLCDGTATVCTVATSRSLHGRRRVGRVAVRDGGGRPVRLLFVPPVVERRECR